MTGKLKTTEEGESTVNVRMPISHWIGIFAILAGIVMNYATTKSDISSVERENVYQDVKIQNLEESQTKALDELKTEFRQQRELLQKVLIEGRQARAD